MISIEIIHTELLNANENEDISCVFFTSGFLLVFLKKVIVIHKNMYFFYKYGLVHNGKPIPKYYNIFKIYAIYLCAICAKFY